MTTSRIVRDSVHKIRDANRSAELARNRAATAEQQVRDLTLEITRLKRRIAELESTT